MIRNILTDGWYIHVHDLIVSYEAQELKDWAFLAVYATAQNSWKKNVGLNYRWHIHYLQPGIGYFLVWEMMKLRLDAYNSFECIQRLKVIDLYIKAIIIARPWMVSPPSVLSKN